jgi:glycosyltransferase involved in cell wall biosynthesis
MSGTKFGACLGADTRAGEVIPSRDRSCQWLIAYVRKKLLLQGMLRGQELHEAYASADIFMMPSESETLGFVVLEARRSPLPPSVLPLVTLTAVLRSHRELVQGSLFRCTLAAALDSVA